VWPIWLYYIRYQFISVVLYCLRTDGDRVQKNLCLTALELNALALIIQLSTYFSSIVHYHNYYCLQRVLTFIITFDDLHFSISNWTSRVPNALITMHMQWPLLRSINDIRLSCFPRKTRKQPMHNTWHLVKHWNT